MAAKKSARAKSAVAGPKPTAKKKKASVPLKKEKGLPAKKKTSTGAKRKATTRSGTRSSAGARAGALAVPGRGGNSLPVVGVGASAGGLEAFTELLKHLPANTGMAFVFIQHMDPRHKSSLAEILARSTHMSIAEATDGVRLEADQIYVTPPNMEMAVLHGVLHLMPRPESPARHMPIDSFFRSLAEDQGNKAIGVILSGTGSDGALGLGTIKAESGITFAQDQESAKYGGMPSAAVAAGHVDFTLPPAGIAQELALIGRHPHIEGIIVRQADQGIDAPEALQKIFILLRRASGVDFTYYKQNTVERRISRRMALHKIESIDRYVKYLQETPGEVDALFEDMLINVTGFFRDRELFDVFKQKVFPRIIENKPPDAPIRVWVPGCSTGEEGYSIAIALLEYLGENDLQSPIQFFATDVSDVAIEKAREGRYPENIAADVSPERLRRFFVGSEDGYQISKTIRDMCVFAKHNVVKDPPFSKIDLLSCRNLLIYLGPELQKRVIPAFHYALKPAGCLILGTSETIGGFSDLFSLFEKKYKLYSKKPTAARLPVDFGTTDLAPGPEPVAKRPPPVAWSRLDLQREADRIVLSKYEPGGVVINEQMEILQFRGHTGRYLEAAPGEASFSLLKMGREGLLLDLRASIHKARKENAAVRKEGLRIAHNGQLLEVNIEVIPIGPFESEELHFLILFEEVPAGPPEPKEPRVAKSRKKETGATPANREVERLRSELAGTKETLQAIIEEHESSNEELRAANEEIQSSNEELQSTNEELETAKEELQSTNEELTTLNEELENRNLELNQAINDLDNLLNTVNIPIVMLGRDLRIRTFTPLAEKVLKLIPADTGRPISELKLGIQVPDLEQQVLRVIETLNAQEIEVRAEDGCWYSIRIRPYRTSDDKIDGAVMAVVDITERKRAEEAVRDAEAYAQSIVATVRQPLVVLDGELRVVSANRAFYENFHVKPRDTENQLIFELGNRQWAIPKLRTLLEEIIPENTEFHDFQVEHDFPEIGYKQLLVNARRIDQEGDRAQLILLAIEEVTDGKKR